MNREEIIEQQNAYYMTGYPSRRSENKIDKDEMKNKISMALKDPILQQGFEIICKENAELKQYIENMYANHCGNCNRNILNTELKNRISATAEQFIKAKEIIKNLIDDLTAIDGDEVKELRTVKEAEQFIKEEVGC